MAKVGILNPFFSRYFLGVLTHFMALFMAGNTHSLLFSNILLMHHQSSTDAIRKKLFCQERKKLQALQSFLCFSPIHDTFSVVHVFFREKLYACVLVLFARLIFMPNRKENSCLHFQKRYVSMI